MFEPARPARHPAATAIAIAAVASLAVSLPACLKARSEQEPTARGEGACAAACHGDGTTPAPPRDTNGNADTASPGVGAHRLHLAASSTHSAFACGTCHVVPKSASERGHVDSKGPAELVFGGMATTSQHLPRYDASSRTCSATYCHNGPKVAEPWASSAVWTRPRSSSEACGTSCHSLPPGGAHPKASSCEQCHPDTAGPGGVIKNVALHIDGIVQVKGGGSCNSCHGSAQSNAPPLDLAGNKATSAIGVGAHQSHLAGGAFSKAVECAACHKVPQSVDDPGHNDTPSPAEVTFSGLATSAGAAPAWNHAGATCSGSYCHGAKLGGGTIPAPVWTSVDGTQAACGSCHGLPPPAPHAQSTACESCHAETAGPGMTIATRANHVDGKVQVATTCNSCHGSAKNDAPPTDTSGSSQTSSTGVGAHQSHLAGGAFSRAVECVECHLVPQSVGSAGHLDSDLPAELTFSGVALASGASPAWIHASATCTGSYCHGAKLAGGSHPAPVWTNVGTGEAACGACHAIPPPAPHAASSACELCHRLAAGPGLTIKDRARHVDGLVEVPKGPCNLCHGDATMEAPPKDTKGNTDTTAPGVGAHRNHLEGSKMPFALPLACTTCHPVPPQSTKHMSGAADVTFTGISSGNLAGQATQHKSTPSYAGSPASTCAQVYCHGGWTEVSNPSGGAVTTPTWTKVDGTQGFCGACHSLPPPFPHPQTNACAACHPSVVDATYKIIDRGKHINGKVDF
jgi:predicted CxxxxCH...CXXCH cytochrome family protein